MVVTPVVENSEDSFGSRLLLIELSVHGSAARTSVGIKLACAMQAIFGVIYAAEPRTLT
jgi:hypothetical protein